MSELTPTVGEVLAHARGALATGADDAALEAQILLGHALGRNRAWLIAHRDDRPTREQLGQFNALLDRRCNGEPVAYILGHREFWSLDLLVTPDVLIPRPDTECLVERALAHLSTTGSAAVLDTGTGSGAIALALAVERPNTVILASDRDCGALRLAARNATRLAENRAALFQGNWLDAVADETLDLIVSNPPYVAEDDGHLLLGDVRFEPRQALVADDAGLSAIEALTLDAPRCLKPNGWLLVEHGSEQAVAVRRLFVAGGFSDVSTAVDFAGNDRVTEGRWPAPDIKVLE